jgi:hypothetical protein
LGDWAQATIIFLPGKTNALNTLAGSYLWLVFPQMHPIPQKSCEKQGNKKQPPLISFQTTALRPTKTTHRQKQTLKNN